MKWSEIEQQRRKELELSGKKSKLVTLVLWCVGICLLLVCFTVVVFALRLQTTGGA